MLNQLNSFNMNNVQFTPEGQLKEMGVTYNVKAQLGRPVNPNSVRQQRLAQAPGRKTGRPINADSNRQQRLRELAIKRVKGGGTIKRGRPVNTSSARQVRLADLDARRAAGTLKRGRPAGSVAAKNAIAAMRKKGNTAKTPVEPVVVVLNA